MSTISAPITNSTAIIAGDEVLRQLAGALAEEIRRPVDLLARYHGDQFVALLPDTDGTGAGHVADRLLERVRDLRLPLCRQ